MDYEKITLAVVTHKILPHRNTLFIIDFWHKINKSPTIFFSAGRGHGISEMISGNLVCKILVIELSSEVIFPNVMSLTKKIEHPKLPRAKKTLAWIHFSISCSDQGPLGIIMSSNSSISTFK